MASFLRNRNGNYHFRLRIPADLRSIIPQPEILKSLHTSDRKVARRSASVLLPRFLEIFALSRCEFLTPDQVRQLVDNLLNRKGQANSNFPPRQVEPTPPTLQKIIYQYTTDNANGWTAKTRLEYESYYRLLIDVVGNIQINAINRDVVRNVRDTLVRLPSNLYKKYPNLSINEILALPNVTPMSITTVNKLLTLFGSLMRHSIKEGYRQDNPVDGLKVPKTRRADEERKSYSRNDLKKIVASLPSPAARPERFWIPLIGMYSGMRLGEICGLHVDDVKEYGHQDEKVWCFDVNEQDEKRLKTAASNRIVPIHPQLINIGFIEYVESMRSQNSKRLWPKLVRRDVDGYCSAVGNWYGRFNRRHITTDPLKTFHSLRHTFADTMKQKGVQESVISELMGHANESITTGRYGKRYQPKVLLEAVLMLDY